MFKEIEHHGLAVILSETNKKVQKDTTAGQGTYFLYKPGKQESKNTPPPKKRSTYPWYIARGHRESSVLKTDVFYPLPPKKCQGEKNI